MHPITLITAHPYMSMIVGFAIYNAYVQSLEEPTAQDGRGYRQWYRFNHLLAFNFQYAMTKKFPDYVAPGVAKQPDTK